MHPPVILVFRGSPDPAAARLAADLIRAVALARPRTRIRGAYLDFGVPSLPAALAKEAGLGHRAAVVVPMLLTAGYHARVRIPAEISAAVSAGLPLRVQLAAVLGPSADRQEDEIRLGIARTLLRLVEQAAAEVSGRHSASPMWERLNRRLDAIVLVATGSRASRARDAVDRVAAAMHALSGIPCETAFVIGGPPHVAEAVSALRRRAARNVAVATYLLMPGRRYTHVATVAWSAGADMVADPLALAPELTAVILQRVDAATLTGA